MHWRVLSSAIRVTRWHRRPTRPGRSSRRRCVGELFRGMTKARWPRRVNRWRVVAIDLDGTVVPGTTVCRHLGEWLGHQDAVEELEQRFARGEIGNSEMANADAGHFRGVLAEDVTATMAS